MPDAIGFLPATVLFSGNSAGLGTVTGTAIQALDLKGLSSQDVALAAAPAKSSGC
jgi:hypothetical protein